MQIASCTGRRLSMNECVWEITINKYSTYEKKLRGERGKVVCIRGEIIERRERESGVH